MYRLKIKVRDFVNKNSFLNKTYKLASGMKTKINKNVSDEKYAKSLYKSNTGKKLNLNNPKTFNEKLYWLKLNNRDPLLTTCTDKYKVRKYIEKCGLKNILNDLYGVYDKAEDINFNDLPEKAFIKTNHGSFGGRVWDKSDPFDKTEFVKEFNKLLKKNYYWNSREWNYKNIEPKIIIEKLLETNDNRGLVDYKFMCFDGNVRLVFVELDIIDKDGTKNHFSKRNVYDRNFNYINMQFGRKNMDKSLTPKPIQFEKMIEYAEIISKPFPHCRVDLYNIEGKIIFGETTFYHAGCTNKITPAKYNEIMGDWIDLKSNKIVLREQN